MLRRSRFYVEEDEHLDEDIDTTENETEEGSDNTEDSDDGGFESINFDASKDEYDMDEDIAYGDENVDEEDVKSNTPTTMAVDVDITTMGSDNSPVQNQYSPKEIERLNNLLSSENQAIGEYFQASKETNVDILRRLYSDIGEEERFHSEQLLFAKSQLTGEPYVPRDPDVKKEYEELLALGMDEESAMTTAVDKVGISRSINASNEEIEQKMEAAIEDMEFIQRSLYQEYVLMNILSTPEYNRERVMKTYTEAYINQSLYTVDIVMEDVVNNIENPPERKGILKVIIGIITGIGNAIRRILENMKLWGVSLKSNIERKREWLKNHSLADLFRSGVNMYFFNEKIFDFDLKDPIKYMYRIMNCAEVISNKLGISGNIKSPNITIFNEISENYVSESGDDIEEKINNLSKVKLIKTKVPLSNDKIKEVFATKVFQIRIGSPGIENNTYNTTVHGQLTKLASNFAEINSYIGAIAQEMEKMQEQQHSMYRTDRQTYDKYENLLKILANCCQKFISALSSDISQMMKMSKYFNEAVMKDDNVVNKNFTKLMDTEIQRVKETLQQLEGKSSDEQEEILTDYISRLEQLKNGSTVKESYTYRGKGHSRFYTEDGEATAQPQQVSEDDKTTIDALIDLAKSLLEIAKQKTPDKVKDAVDFSVNFVQGFAHETADKIRSGISKAIEGIKAIKNGRKPATPTPQPNSGEPASEPKDASVADTGTDTGSQQSQTPAQTQNNGGGNPAEPTATNVGTNTSPQTSPTPRPNSGEPASQRKDADYLKKTYGGFVDEHARKLNNFRGELKRIKVTGRSIRKNGDVINDRLNELKTNVNTAKAMFDRMYNKFREDAGLPTKSITESYYFQEGIFDGIFKKKDDHPVDSAISSVADRFHEVENGYNDILKEIDQNMDKVNPLAAERNERDKRSAQRQQFHDENNDKFSSQAAAERERKNGTTGSEEAMRVAAAKDPEYTGRERWDDKRYSASGRRKLKKTPEGISELYAVNRASIGYLIREKDKLDPKSKQYANMEFRIKRFQQEQQELAEKYQRMTGKTIEEFYIPRYISKDIIQEYVSAIESEITEDPLFGYFS